MLQHFPRPIFTRIPLSHIASQAAEPKELKVWAARHRCRQHHGFDDITTYFDWFDRSFTALHMCFLSIVPQLDRSCAPETYGVTTFSDWV